MRTASLALLLLVCAATVGATTVDDICSPPGSPQGNKPCACTATTCEVRSMGDVSDGSLLDFAGRDLVLKQRGKLNVRGGTMRILARNVTMEGGSALLGIPSSGPGGSITVEASGDLGLLKAALIDITGAPAGVLSLDAAGSLQVAGDLRANGTDEEGGGTIFLDATTISISGTIEYFGRGVGFAGDADLQTVAGLNLAATATVDGSGSDGGTLMLATTTGDITTAAQLKLQATQGGGGGGSLTLESGGGVGLGGQVRLAGDGSGEGSGDGGDLDVSADGPIKITAALLDLAGAPPEGSGGSASFFSEDSITAPSAVVLQVQSRGSGGFGGSADLDAEGALALPAIDASAKAAGRGGTVLASAWCDVSLAPGRTIDASGPEGDITLTTGNQLTVTGSLLAGRENRLEYRDPNLPPALTGATITPAPVLAVIPGLIPCGGLVVEGCGDGNKTGTEQCDDGNTASCDGCSRLCTIETNVCGDGTLDDECEACDDGNMTDCDGCYHDCSRADRVCGDGIPECGEDGDLGDAVPCDGLSATCRFETCGNEIKECAEECDEGTQGSPACSTGCRSLVPPRCGDGVVQLEDGETCDMGPDGVDCDGCSRTCQFDGCGSGAIEPNCNEECDDFNTRSGDGCSGSCTIEICGNGRTDVGEACDDGNQNECDGCRSDCTVPTRPCPICTTASTEPCVPCAGTIDCDPLRACGASLCSAGVCTPVDPPSCNDGNRCTTDACDPARGCVNAPVTCADATACDGVQSCDPATGQCASSPAPACDDQDACTDDSCSETGVPGFACQNALRPGLDGARCRLSGLQSLIDSADLPTSTRKKLRKQAKGIARKLPVAAGTGRKATKARKQVSNGLKALTRTVAKAQSKLDPATVNELNTAITRATVAVGNL